MLGRRGIHAELPERVAIAGTTRHVEMAAERVSRLAAQLAPEAAAAGSPYAQSRKRFAPGPLDVYRHAASFDWEALQRSWFGESLVKYREHVWGLLERDPLFRQPVAELEVPRARARPRRRVRTHELTLAFRQMKRFIEWDLTNEEDLMANPVIGLELPCILGAYDWSTSAKLFLHLQSASSMRCAAPHAAPPHTPPPSVADAHAPRSCRRACRDSPSQCLRAPSRPAAPTATASLWKRARTSSTSAASA